MAAIISRASEADLLLVYRSIVRREPNAAEVQAFRDRESKGWTLTDLIRALGATDEAKAYRTRLFVPPGHFYSPVVDIETVRDAVPRVRLRPPGLLRDVQIDLGRMERFWIEVLSPIATTTPFKSEQDSKHRYFFENPAFGHADAITLRAMLLHHRPKRVIEVGSGYSSACMLDTLYDEAGLDTKITFVDPFPELLKSLLKPGDSDRTEIVPTPVQHVPLSVFEELKEGDILFIDSTHILKTHSDVAYELSNVLPCLRPGVLIHFHDIFYPFEYGYHWIVAENRSWNEVYALRAFLAFNSSFEVRFFNDMFAQLRCDLLKQTCPDFLKNTGGSIWLERVQ